MTLKFLKATENKKCLSGACARLRILPELTRARRYATLCVQITERIRVEIKKAIITAAGKSQATLPLQTLVDRDGSQKTALIIIVEEVLKAGIEEICVVVRPGDQAAYRGAAGPHADRVRFVEQSQPARLRPRGLLRARIRRRRAVPASRRRSSLCEPRFEELRAATGGDRAGGILRRFRRAGDARKQTARSTASSAANWLPDARAFTRSNASWKNPRPPRPSKR